MLHWEYQCKGKQLNKLLIKKLNIKIWSNKLFLFQILSQIAIWYIDIKKFKFYRIFIYELCRSHIPDHQKFA